MSSEDILIPAEILIKLRPSSRNTLPKVRQVYLSLYEAIESGQLPFGFQLPSSRVMSKQLGVGRNLIISVYEQLIAEGLLVAEGRRGTKVARKITKRETDGDTVWNHSKRHHKIKSYTTEHHVFVPGEPDTTLFPKAKWRRALATAADLPNTELGYNSQASSATRLAISRYLATYRSLTIDPEQIIVTSSTRQSIALSATLYGETGDTAWIECPGYLGAVDAFSLSGLDVHPCRLDSNGLVVPKKTEKAPRFIYLTPCFQYPLGYTLGVERRDALLEYAAKHDVILFEDDYDSEFRDDRQPRPALAAEPQGAQILYAGTFSKLLFPSIRVAWLVVPKSSTKYAHKCLRATGGCTNTILQAAITELLNNGSITEHMKHARNVYRRRRRMFIAELADWGLLDPDHHISGSLSLVLRLKKKVPILKLEAALNNSQIGAIPLERLEWNTKTHTHSEALVVGLGNVETLQISHTTKRLISILNEL